MTPNTFLENHVRDLLSMQIDYGFLRNSEAYPHKLTGDIDVLVKITSISRIYKYYNEIENEEIQVIQIIRKKRDLYVMLFFPNSKNRKFLVLEYYTGIVFRGQVVIPGDSLLKNCEAVGIWRRLPKATSISYTYFHYSIYKGHLPQKYHDDFHEYGLDGQLTKEVNTFLDSDQKFDLDSTEKLGHDIRQQLSKTKMLFNYLHQFLYFRRKSLGCSLKVNPDDAQACLDFADKYHLYRPTYRYIVRSNPIVSELISLLVVFLGGLVIHPKEGVAKSLSPEKYFKDQIQR